MKTKFDPKLVSLKPHEQESWDWVVAVAGEVSSQTIAALKADNLSNLKLYGRCMACEKIMARSQRSLTQEELAAEESLRNSEIQRATARALELAGSAERAGIVEKALLKSDGYSIAPIMQRVDTGHSYYDYACGYNLLRGDTIVAFRAADVDAWSWR